MTNWSQEIKGEGRGTEEGPSSQGEMGNWGWAEPLLLTSSLATRFQFPLSSPSLISS